MLIVMLDEGEEPIDKILLKQLVESIRWQKVCLKMAQRLYPQSGYYQKRRELRVLEAQLRMLRVFVWQIQTLQRKRKGRRSSMVEQSPRKRQVEGSSPSAGSNTEIERYCDGGGI